MSTEMAADIVDEQNLLSQSQLIGYGGIRMMMLISWLHTQNRYLDSVILQLIILFFDECAQLVDLFARLAIALFKRANVHLRLESLLLGAKHHVCVGSQTLEPHLEVTQLALRFAVQASLLF